MRIIFHITTTEAWKNAQAAGQYIHPSLAAEGFIHCAEERQVPGVLDRYFAGQTGLVKLVIDTSLLTAPLRDDFSPSMNDSFPHIYGVLNCSAVIAVLPV